MKKQEILVGEVQIAEFRKRLRALLESKAPIVVLRRSCAIAVLLPVETSYFGSFDHPIKQRRRLFAELKAVVRKLAR